MGASEEEKPRAPDRQMKRSKTGDRKKEACDPWGAAMDEMAPVRQTAE